MEEFVVKEEKVGQFTVKVVQDDCCNDSPRDWDNLGTMICFHRRYNLGDKHKYSVEEAVELEQSNNGISLPLFLYDHSGISISTSNSYPYNDRWDAGKVGIIYVSDEKIKKEYSVDEVTPEVAEKVRQVLKAEVQTYDSYLRGEVYGFTVTDEDGELVESCWGFIGDADYCLTEGKATAQYKIDHNPLQLDLPIQN